MRCHLVGCGTHTRAVDPISEYTFVDARQSLHGRSPCMILRAILALLPPAICIFVVVLAYRKTRDR
jgi:hypothetical protein